MTVDPATLPGAEGHRTGADHYRTAEMHAAAALAAYGSKTADWEVKYQRHLELATLHNQMAATRIAAAGLVATPNARAEVGAWTNYFLDHESRERRAAAKHDTDRTSRVRGLPS